MSKLWKPLLLCLVAVLAVTYWLVWEEGLDFNLTTSSVQCENTPARIKKPFRFIAYGDWGQGTPFQRRLADQMARLYEEKPFSAALLLGDNIYPDGDILKLAKSHFEEPYAPLIRNRVQFIVSIGNHDDRNGHKQDQIEYFNMPGPFYRTSLNDGQIDVFVLDTTRFSRSSNQQEWFARELANSTARWKIVVGHHPVYSSGKHGNTEGLKEILEPMLTANGVDLYLAGHDHDYERLGPVEGVRYFVSGGGGTYLYDFEKIVPQSQFRAKTHHFLFFEVDGNHIWVKAVNKRGEVIDCTHWRKGLLPKLLKKAA